MVILLPVKMKTGNMIILILVMSALVLALRHQFLLLITVIMMRTVIQGTAPLQSGLPLAMAREPVGLLQTTQMLPVRQYLQIQDIP